MPGASHLRLIEMTDNGRMSRTLVTRIAAVLIGLAAVVLAVWAIQDVVAGPEDRDLGPVVVNTHEPNPSPTVEEPEPTTSPAEPSPTEPAPVDPAPPVIVEEDWDYDDWDDDDWDDDDWDDDDWDDDDWDDDDDDDWDDDDDDD